MKAQNLKIKRPCLFTGGGGGEAGSSSSVKYPRLAMESLILAMFSEIILFNI
jgi:hypothetical protein